MRRKNTSSGEKCLLLKKKIQKEAEKSQMLLQKLTFPSIVSLKKKKKLQQCI